MTCLAFSRDGQKLACHHTFGLVLVDAETGEQRYSLRIGVYLGISVHSAIYFSVSFSDDFIAVSGGGEDSTRVAIWAVGALKQKSALLDSVEFLEYGVDVGPVAFSLDSRHLAVITSDGALLIRSCNVDGNTDARTPREWPQVRLRAPDLAVPTNICHGTALVFSFGGTLLAAQWATGVARVFDISTSACIATFCSKGIGDVPGWAGNVLAFSPDDRLLAAGGGHNVNVVVHRLNAGCLAAGKTTFCILGSGAAISRAALTPRWAVLVGPRGTAAVVQRRDDGEEVCRIETSSVDGSDSYGFDFVEVQPSGEHVALCAGRDQWYQKHVIVCALPSGREVFRVSAEDEAKDGATCNITRVHFSPDGKKLMVLLQTLTAADSGGKPLGSYFWNLYDLEAGRRLSVGPRHEGHCLGFDTNWSFTRMAVAASDGVSVVDIRDDKHSVIDVFDKVPTKNQEDVLSNLRLRPVFDGAAKRLAYAACFPDSSNAVVVRDLSGGREVCRYETADKLIPAGFSPGDGSLLLCAKFDLSLNEMSSVVVLSTTHGTEMRWCKSIPLMVGGHPNNCTTVGWQHSPADRGAVRPRIAWVAFGPELITLDLDELPYTEADGSIATSQLLRLTSSGDSITNIANRYPDCVARRCTTQSGNTVLHNCARERNEESIGKWLTGDVVYTPIQNDAGNTALDIAIRSGEQNIARYLWRRSVAEPHTFVITNRTPTHPNFVFRLRSLTQDLNATSAPFVTRSLKLLAQKMPRMVLPFLTDLEHTVIQDRASFATTLSGFKTTSCVFGEYISGRSAIPALVTHPVWI